MGIGNVPGWCLAASQTYHLLELRGRVPHKKLDFVPVAQYPGLLSCGHTMQPRKLAQHPQPSTRKFLPLPFPSSSLLHSFPLKFLPTSSSRSVPSLAVSDKQTLITNKHTNIDKVPSPFLPPSSLLPPSTSFRYFCEKILIISFLLSPDKPTLTNMDATTVTSASEPQSSKLNEAATHAMPSSEQHSPDAITETNSSSAPATAPVGKCGCFPILSFKPSF